jgi:beta-xylosidase
VFSRKNGRIQRGLKMQAVITPMGLRGRRSDARAPAIDDARAAIWRNNADLQLNGVSLLLDAKGTGPADARLFLVTTVDEAYEVQVEVTVPSGGVGGLILFYNEKTFTGLASDGKEFTFYRDAVPATREPNTFGGLFFLKVVNQQARCVFLASADGKTWTSLMADVDMSGLQHDRFWGFLALRPGLIAAGDGKVRFERFVYKNNLLPVPNHKNQPIQTQRKNHKS